MREELLEQLEEWHEQDEFEEIVDAITAIDVEERDYELIGHLGRALNNLERYEEAVEQFLTVAEEGQDDPCGIIALVWHIITWSNMRRHERLSKQQTDWIREMKIHRSFSNGFAVKQPRSLLRK